MPDYRIPEVQTPNSMNTLGQMINFAGGAQNLQKGAIELQRARETLAADIAKTKAESEVSVGTAQPRIAQSQEAEKQAKIKTSHEQYKLTAEQEQAARNLSSALVADDDFIKGNGPAMIEKLRNHREEAIRSGIPASTAEAHFGSMINLATMKPEAVRQAMQNHINAGIGATGQSGITNAPLTPVNEGQTIGFRQLQPGAPGAFQANQAVQATLPVSATESIVRGPDGNDYAVEKDSAGRIVNTRSLSSANRGSTPQGAPRSMPFISPEDQLSRPGLEAERNQARTVLSGAPIAHTTNQGILQEIDNVAATGRAGPALQSIMSTLGVRFDTPEQRASSYDIIGKFMERNAIEAAKAMGPNTNAGLDAAIKANGSVAYNPTAIKKITKLNDALVSGAEAYQPGLEKAIAANPDRGVLVKREYDQAWAQNFDPRVMEIANAAKVGDKKAIEEIKKAAGPEGVKELVRKARNIELLSTQGRL